MARIKRGWDGKDKDKDKILPEDLEKLASAEPLGIVRILPGSELSMWDQALEQIIHEVKERGDTTVDFAEVDKLVLEWSKAPLAELMEALR